MKRMHLKKPKNNKNKKVNILITTILIVIIATFILINYMGRKVNPFLLDYAEIEVRKITGIVVNGVVSNNIKKDNLNNKEIFNIIKNDKDEINMVDFNSAIITEFIGQVTNDIYTDLKALEIGNLKKLTLPYTIFSDYNYSKLSRGIIYEIPSLSYLGNTFLSNLGPKIPIRFTVVGSVSGHLETEIKAYGINNAIVNVYLNLEITEFINLPFSFKKITIVNRLPISIKMIQGKVPTYYQGGLNQSSPILVNPVD